MELIPFNQRGGNHFAPFFSAEETRTGIIAGPGRVASLDRTEAVGLNLAK
jgi:hypothetical protein